MIRVASTILKRELQIAAKCPNLTTGPVYNPWSIARHINERGVLKAYWINTSDNKLIKDLLLKSSIDMFANEAWPHLTF